MKRNSGSILTRGYGLFNRILTRGFGSYLIPQVFKKKRDKLPIEKEFLYEIYFSIEHRKEFNFNIFRSLIRTKELFYNLKSDLIKEFSYSYNVFIPLKKSRELSYNLTTKINNKKLIENLVLLEDD